MRPMSTLRRALRRSSPSTWRPTPRQPRLTRSSPRSLSDVGLLEAHHPEDDQKVQVNSLRGLPAPPRGHLRVTELTCNVSIVTVKGTLPKTAVSHASRRTSASASCATSPATSRATARRGKLRSRSSSRLVLEDEQIQHFSGVCKSSTQMVSHQYGVGFASRSLTSATSFAHRPSPCGRARLPEPTGSASSPSMIYSRSRLTRKRVEVAATPS